MQRSRYGERAELDLAVVVGAGGLSMAVARRLAQRHRILIADIDPQRVDASVQLLRDDGAVAEGVSCDITLKSDVQVLAERSQAMGGFRVMAQVAGLSPSMGDFADIMRVNLLGPSLLADAFLPLASTGSVALFTSSLAAHNFSPSSQVASRLLNTDDPQWLARLLEAVGADFATSPTAYQLSKYGLMQLCRQRASDWGLRGARIVSVSPGLIASPMGAREYKTSSSKTKLFDLSPLGREGSMLEIADCFEFLASDRASFISGTDILVDGGLAAAVANAATLTKNRQPSSQ